MIIFVYICLLSDYTLCKQYRQMRRKEQDRLARMDVDYQRRKEMAEFNLRREERMKAAEERTAKKRLKRQKKKQKKKEKKVRLTSVGGEEQQREESSDDDGGSDDGEGTVKWWRSLFWSSLQAVVINAEAPYLFNLEVESGKLK